MIKIPKKSKKFAFNKKNIIITISILLLFVIILFNFENFTGHASRFKNEPIEEEAYVPMSAEIIPNVLKAGEKVSIYLNPGSECAQRRIDILRANGRRVASFEKLSGGYKYCEPAVIKYKTYNNWLPGEYSARIYEWCSGRYCDPDFIDANFTLK